MQPLHRRINPQTFVITLQQIAKYLKTNPKGILNWEKWEHVLWVHLEGRGGYFISYRQLQQWIAACRTLIRGCRNLSTLDALWSAILQEAERYTQDAFAQLEAIWQQRLSYLSTHQLSLETPGKKAIAFTDIHSYAGNSFREVRFRNFRPTLKIAPYPIHANFVI